MGGRKHGCKGGAKNARDGAKASFNAGAKNARDGAKAAFNAGDYSTATSLYKLALKDAGRDQSSDDVLYANLAQCYLNTKDAANAAKAAQEAIDCNSSNVKALYRLAKARKLQALDAVQQGLKLDPANSELQALLAELQPAKKLSTPEPAKEKEQRTVVIEVLAGEGEGLTNTMHNHVFASRAGARDYISKQAPLVQPMSWPWADFLGWDLQMYLLPDRNPTTLNALCIYLGTAEVGTAISSYPDLTGDALIIGWKKGSTMDATISITSDILWGMMCLCQQAMDMSDEDIAAWPSRRLRSWVAQYKAERFEPVAGTAGINIYETTPELCKAGDLVEGETATTDPHSKEPIAKKSCFDADGLSAEEVQDIELCTAAYTKRLREVDDEDPDDAADGAREAEEVHSFYEQCADQFPAEAIIVEHLRSRLPEFRCDLMCYSHALAVRLYRTAGIRDVAQQFAEVRRLGYILYHRGGKGAMLVHYYAVQHSMGLKSLIPGGHRTPAVVGYAGVFERTWDGIGDWVP